MRHMVLAVLAAWAGLAHATDPVKYISSGGGLFSYDENRYGAVMTVIDRQSAAMVADPDLYDNLAVGDVLYLGRACDALSRKFGDGRWISTEGGFLIIFAEARVIFPGQSIDLRTYADCIGELPAE